MTTTTVTLNPGSGGAATLFDTLTTVDGAAAPVGAVAQMAKVGYGTASDFKTVTPATPMPVVSVNGIVSTVNSTIVNLAAGIAFTGTWEDVSEYSTVMASVFSSHASATDGLSVQFSSNGVDADLTDVFNIPAATGKTFSFGVTAKFYRLVYTNSATATTSLRIQSLLSRTAKKYSSQRPQDGRGNDNDFEEALVYPMGFDGVSWNRLRATIANGLAVDVTRLPALALSAPLKATYSASVNALAPALTPSDIFTITGSATKTIKIHSIQIDATATAAAVVAVFLVKRSTANAAGTSTAPTRVPLDSASAAVTGTVLAYTANPTTGALVGNVRSEKLLVSTTTSSGETLLINFGDTLGSPVVLRGITEVLGVNLNGVSLAGGSVNLFVEWTEE